VAYGVDNPPKAVSYSGAVNPTSNVSHAYDLYFPRLVTMADGAGTTPYSYVPVGSPGALEIAQETPPGAGGPIAYAYDALGRLATRTLTGAGPETFGHDAIGRLIPHADDMGAFALVYLGQTASRQLTGSTLATSWSYLSNTGDRRLAGITSVGLTPSQTTGVTHTSDAAIRPMTLIAEVAC
jgi:hypothetical protein